MGQTVGSVTMNLTSWWNMAETRGRDSGHRGQAEQHTGPSDELKPPQRRRQ